MLGFDPSSRTWVTAGPLASPAEPLPALDGALLVSDQALREASQDFGHVVSHRPSALLKPGSAEDIARMIRFARRHRLRIAARGQAHTMYGHAQAAAGIIIDMSSLSALHSMTADRIEVEAGALWSAVAARTVSAGLTPPVLPGYVQLSVGGTLSVGGVSGESFRYGAQVDNVLELQVVTGEGELVTCSPALRPELFEAMLAGLGQCGIIVRATLRLIPAPPLVRIYELEYADTGAQIRDMLRLIEEGRFDYVVGFVLPGLHGGWECTSSVASFFTPPRQPDDARLLEGLSHRRVSQREVPYGVWVNRLDEVMDDSVKLGSFSRPHPWCDLFVPASRLEGFVSEVLQEIPPEEITPHFPILMYPFKRRPSTQPLMRVPDVDRFVLLDILRTEPPSASRLAQMVEHNRRLYERNRSWGGTHYTISAIPLSPADWREHFGPAWERFEAAKRRYDPGNVLTPGPGIFG